jgi:hypothetical protein
VHIAATNHAVERYRDRVRPGYSFADARRDLLNVAEAAGTISDEAPSWVVESDLEADRRYMKIGDDICAVLEPTSGADRAVIVTVLFKGGLSPQARARRNRYAAHKRARRRARRIKR